MKKTCRYNTSGMIEDQHEEGSNGLVLKNIPGIKTSQEMGLLETKELLRANEQLIERYGSDHRFTASDICFMHRVWLGSLYEWAGRYRNVRISKGDFPFANPEFIPKLMNDFEKNILSRYTPCTFVSNKKIIEALSIVHVELLLIHPFREGNGRVARLLATLMALQAGLPLLDFTEIEGSKKDEYFAAVRAGL
ncbi:MAG: Fic family protein, partial [Proteobacteria bacterium]|nr:Fic family protein [Pseudomonadota bacterium]